MVSESVHKRIKIHAAKKLSTMDEYLDSIVPEEDAK